MEEFEIRLFDLLEHKSFDRLSEEERIFVLSHLSEDEYRAQQQIVHESGQLEYEIPVPLPLTVRPTVPFLRRSVPLYQVLLAAGCVALLVYILRPAEQKTAVQFAGKQADSISPLQANVVHDTVTLFVEVIKYHEKLVHDTVSVVQSVYSPQRETRLLEAGNALQFPPVSTLSPEAGGASLSSDRTTGLLPKIVNSGIFGNER